MNLLTQTVNKALKEAAMPYRTNLLASSSTHQGILIMAKSYFKRKDITINHHTGELSSDDGIIPDHKIVRVGATYRMEVTV